MKSYQIRAKAKDLLTGGWKTFSLTSVLYIVLLLLVSYVPRLAHFPYWLTFLFQNGLNLFLSYGLFAVFWKYSKLQEVRFYDFLLIGFGNMKRAFLVFFYTAIRLLLPFLVSTIFSILIAGSMIGSFVYQMQSGTYSPFLIVVLVVSCILTLISYYIFFSQSLYYVFSSLIAIEQPELSEKECVKKSKELMKGHRLSYLSLLLSFTGWIFVGICTLCIRIYLDFSLFANVFYCIL